MGFEPMTSSLPRKCSTPELRRLIDFEFRMFNFGFKHPVNTLFSNLQIPDPKS
jgi:hypothetical protein